MRGIFASKVQLQPSLTKRWEQGKRSSSSVELFWIGPLGLFREASYLISLNGNSEEEYPPIAHVASTWARSNIHCCASCCPAPLALDTVDVEHADCDSHVHLWRGKQRHRVSLKPSQAPSERGEVLDAAL